MAAQLKALVRNRARFRCEYCHFPEEFAELRFQLDHIRAEQHGGPTTPANLAWSCLRCNKQKGPNLSGIDPKTGRTVRLFNPRADLWRRTLGGKVRSLQSVGVRCDPKVLRCFNPDL